MEDRYYSVQEFKLNRYLNQQYRNRGIAKKLYTDIMYSDTDEKGRHNYSRHSNYSKPVIPTYTDNKDVKLHHVDPLESY